MITLVQGEFDNINQMVTITMTFKFKYYNSEQMRSMKYDHIKQLITLSVIPLSDFRFAKQERSGCYRNTVEVAKCNHG